MQTRVTNHQYFDEKTPLHFDGFPNFEKHFS